MMDELGGWNRRPSPQNQCESITGGRQCVFGAVPGSRFCPRHKGDLAIAKQTREAQKSYHLGIYQSRYKDFASDPGIKSLREEIGVTRMMLEEIFNRCQDNPAQLMINMPRINELIQTIRKLVDSCDRIEKQMGVTLDRASILNIGDVIVNVISTHVSDPAILQKITDDIVVAMSHEKQAIA